MLKEAGLKLLLNLGGLKTAVEPVSDNGFTTSKTAKILFDWEIKDGISQNHRLVVLNKMCSDCPVRKIDECSGGIPVDGFRISCSGARPNENNGFVADIDSGALMQNGDSEDDYERREKRGLNPAQWERVLQDIPCLTDTCR